MMVSIPPLMAWHTVLGMTSANMEEKSIDIVRMAVQTTLMISAEKGGILIFPEPKENAAIKASSESARTSNISCMKLYVVIIKDVSFLKN